MCICVTIDPALSKKEITMKKTYEIAVQISTSTSYTAYVIVEADDIDEAIDHVNDWPNSTLEFEGMAEEDQIINNVQADEDSSRCIDCPDECEL